MSLADLIRKGPAGAAGPAGEVSHKSQVSMAQAGESVQPLRPSAKQRAEVSHKSQVSMAQNPVNPQPPNLSHNNNNNSKVIIYGDTRAGVENDLPVFATVTLATVATDTVSRLWDIRTADGWLEVATCPPASLATMRASYPEALEILPAPEEEDPGTVFYRRLFAGMDAPRATITLSPEEAHQAVIAGLVTPEDTRRYVLLAYRTPEAYGLMATDKGRWDGMELLKILAAPDGLQ